MQKISRTRAPAVTASRGVVSRAVPAPGRGATLAAVGCGRGSVCTTRTVDQEARADRALGIWAAKTAAAKFLWDHDATLAKRVSCCGQSAHGDIVELVAVGAGADRHAYLRGTVQCDSPWSCPVCARRIGRDRAALVNDWLAMAREAGQGVALVSLTCRHGRGDALAALLDGMKRAAKSLKQSKTWRALNLQGSVTATEITHGRNGFHPHFHLLVTLPGRDLSSLQALRAEWLRSLVKHGLSGNGHAFDVQDGSAAGEYVSGWTAGDEVAFTSGKTARAGNRSMHEVLADARDGCRKSAAIWVQYALATKGRNALNLSRGLKKQIEAWRAQQPEPEPESEPVVLKSWAGWSDAWKHARRRRCALIAAAQAGTDLHAAEFGPTDRARWYDRRREAELFEGESARPFWDVPKNTKEISA